MLDIFKLEDPDIFIRGWLAMVINGKVEVAFILSQFGKATVTTLSIDDLEMHVPNWLYDPTFGGQRVDAKSPDEGAAELHRLITRAITHHDAHRNDRPIAIGGEIDVAIIDRSGVRFWNKP